MPLQGREISKKSYLLNRVLPKVFGIKVRYLVSSWSMEFTSKFCYADLDFL